MTQPVNTNWQNYWKDLPHESGLAVWDTDGDGTAIAQLPLFRSAFGDQRPVLDIGCGNGTQTAALAAHFDTVIGLDFAPAAIEHAKELQAGKVADFRQFDLADTEAATALHEELGDVNVYMRGVLHQMPDERRADAARSLATLLGATGRLFAVELSPAAGQTIKTAMAGDETALPKMQQVFRHGLTPAAWSEGKLEALLDGAGLAVSDSGPFPLKSTDALPDGTQLELPMTYVVAGAA